VGGDQETNQVLEKALRVADYFELAELLCVDALYREESAGGHFRVEHQTPDGEAKRNDDDFAHVAAWEWKGLAAEPALHKEELEFETVKLSTRSYK
jgi:succinate dehydrogenase / fumarate reductase flavoprotein subunit